MRIESGFRNIFWKPGVMLLLLLCTCARASELTVVTEDLPPLNYTEQGHLTGLSTDILTAVLEAAGIKASFSLLPWARAYQSALSEPNTLLYTTTRTPEREAVFDWIGPISPRQISVFKLRERKDIQLKSLDDIKNYKLGVVREMASTRSLQERALALKDNFDFAPTAESNFKKLFLGRVDLVVALDWGAYYQTKLLGHQASEIEAVLILDNTHSYYFALNKQSDPALLGKLRFAFDKVKSSGQLDRIKQKYMGAISDTSPAR
jgi:polar amino acid transport system substrate-binding protein